MKTSWFTKVEKDRIPELRGDFKSSLFLRQVLTDMLETKVEEHFKSQYNRKNYEKANWGYEQADAMGYVRGLKEVISLLDDKEESNTPRGRGRPKKEETIPKKL